MTEHPEPYLGGGPKGRPLITAESFYRAFSAQWEIERAAGNLPDCYPPHQHKKRWTDFMLDPGGFLERVMHRLEGAFPLQYRREWYTVDALYVGGEDLFRSGLTYPSAIHALIEHEHESNLEEEMWKLLHWRAPLKVIIGYDWSEEEKGRGPARRRWAEEKVARLLAMLKKVNRSFPENPETEYLFLFGVRFPGEPLSWSARSNTGFAATPTPP